MELPPHRLIGQLCWHQPWELGPCDSLYNNNSDPTIFNNSCLGSIFTHFLAPPPPLYALRDGMKGDKEERAFFLDDAFPILNVMTIEAPALRSG